MREIDWRLRYRAKRNNQLYKFEALLHGMDLKLPDDEIKDEATPEEEKTQLERIEKARIKALNRKRKIHGGAN